MYCLCPWYRIYSVRDGDIRENCKKIQYNIRLQSKLKTIRKRTVRKAKFLIFLLFVESKCQQQDWFYCTVPKTKRWRWFKAIWNGFFPFTWRKSRKSAKLQRFTRPWTEKYIPCYFEPAPAVKFWNSVCSWTLTESPPSK